MESRACIALVSALLIGATIEQASAQRTPQPVVRTGNFIEVANDLFMHLIATADMRYKVAHNLDFEEQIRDQATSRSPTNTSQHETEGDLTYAEVRFGVDFRYQKNLTFQLLFENQSVFDGNLIDDRSNNSNPGGTDVFGRGPSTENPGFRVERYWIRYQFPNTPLRLHVGADLSGVSQSNIVFNDNPKIRLDAEFGALQLWAAAVIEREGQRLGLENDNDSIYYGFGGTYSLAPHIFGLDVVYFRDRFSGADTQTVGLRGGLGWTGQKSNSVWINASWKGRLGPVLGLVQGNLMTGTARGATGGLPAGVPAGRDYDILAGSVIAYAEGDFGVVRPFVGFIWGSGDGDPRDNELHGFATQPQDDSTGIATGLMGHFDRSPAFGGARDYSCPGRLRGVASRANGNAASPYAIGANVTEGSHGNAFAECAHTVANVWNARLGRRAHSGLQITYSNPGTIVIPVGLRLFPLRGHEITGWYVHRRMVDTGLLETALAPELAGRRIGRAQYHELGAFWMWTLNLHFDIRLLGTVGIPTGGTKDLGRLADCNPTVAGVQSCDANDVALRGEARFRARF
ncbi:MAG: hypothetical protein AB7N91_01740 [Candidatus Tectimicrobiota bacterium]